MRISDWSSDVCSSDLFVLAASLVTSLIFYKRFWRGFFKLQTHRGAKVFWSDLHKLTGLWGLWFVTLIAVTGIWYLAEWKITDEAPYRSEEHPSELPSLMRTSYSGYCLQNIIVT